MLLATDMELCAYIVSDPTTGEPKINADALSEAVQTVVASLNEHDCAESQVIVHRLLGNGQDAYYQLCAVCGAGAATPIKKKLAKEYQRLHGQLPEWSDGYDKLRDAWFERRRRQYCHVHEPLKDRIKGLQSALWWSWYSEYLQTDTWRRIRAAALARDRYMCQYPDCTQRAAQVHHQNYDRVGGNEELGDLVSYCLHHHEMIHGRSFGVGSPWQIAAPTSTTNVWGIAEDNDEIPY